MLSVVCSFLNCEVCSSIPLKLCVLLFIPAFVRTICSQTGNTVHMHMYYNRTMVNPCHPGRGLQTSLTGVIHVISVIPTWGPTLQPAKCYPWSEWSAGSACPAVSLKREYKSTYTTLFVGPVLYFKKKKIASYKCNYEEKGITERLKVLITFWV